MRSRREYEGDLSAKTQDADLRGKSFYGEISTFCLMGSLKACSAPRAARTSKAVRGNDGQRTISLLSLFNGSKSPSCGIMHVYASQIFCATQGHTLLQGYCLYAMPRDIHSAVCCCQHDCLNGLVAGK